MVKIRVSCTNSLGRSAEQTLRDLNQEVVQIGGMRLFVKSVENVDAYSYHACEGDLLVSPVESDDNSDED